MVSIETVVKLALTYPETDEHPHFNRRAFRVKKKIFATLLESDHSVNLKLSPGEQFIYAKADPGSVIPIPNGWGKQGWTTVLLKKVNKTLLKEMLYKAFLNAAPAKIRQQLNHGE